MVSEILVTLLKNKWTYIIVAFAILGWFAYSQYNENQQLIHNNVVLAQNEQALKDSLEKTADSVQTLAVFVEDLNDDKTTTENQYNILKTKYELLVDSVRESGTVEVVETDSTITTPFEGKKHIARYKGETVVNINTKQAEWSLDITFDPINTKAVVFSEEGRWKIKTTSLTEGVSLRGISRIDNETLRAIRDVPPSLEEKENNFLGVGGLVETNRLFVGVVMKPNNWQVGLSYKLFDKFGLSNESWSDKIMLSVHYFIF